MEYEHIFIVNAPKFDLLDQSAEFRRFAAFSDLAYSKKARIYIQAECDATDIFEDPKQGKDVESAGVVEDDYRTWVRMTSMLRRCARASTRLSHGFRATTRSRRMRHSFASDPCERY